MRMRKPSTAARCAPVLAVIIIDAEESLRTSRSSVLYHVHWEPFAFLLMYAVVLWLGCCPVQRWRCRWQCCSVEGTSQRP